MGRNLLAAEATNCAAPDTGNMEILAEFGTAQQQEEWLLPLLNGEIRSCFAMTEPWVASSDATNLQSRIERDGDDYVVNAHKWWTSGAASARCKVAVLLGVSNPDADPYHRQSMILVPMDAPGVRVVRTLPVFGHDAGGGHCETLYENVRLPASNLLGEEGGGFVALMQNLPRERLAIGATALAGAEAVFTTTLAYCKEREAFGRPIGKFQHNRFVLAEIATETAVARAFTDKAVLEHNAGKLSVADAAMVKWWNTELCNKVVDRCVQLHGGYGYMREFPVARAFTDSRVQTIFGGTTEIMKEIIGRDLGL